ncbi:MAG: hypothetical protein IJF59_02120 [Clostridia bacterium]|nr:hypothetical protein [Clostridia bacterium]
MIILWILVLVLWFLVTLLKKNRVPGSRRYLKLPFVILAGFPAVWVIHTMNLFPNDQTLLNCLLIVLLLESQIQMGLIRSNSNYDVLFRQTTIAAQIVDDAYLPHYVSGTAVQADEGLLRLSEEASVRSGDLLLHSKPIAGGRVLWQDNIREINAALEELQETREQLGEFYELKKAEVDLKERKFRAEEKSRLYDRIARRVSPQLAKADAILAQAREHPDQAEALLAQVCVISAYIKRLSNLLLVGEERMEVPAGELESCLRESMDNLRLAHVITWLDSSCRDTLPVPVIAELYTLFETVTERLLDQMTALFLTLETVEGRVSLRMQIGVREAPDEAVIRGLALSGGTVACEVQETDLVIHVQLGEGGEAG